MKYLLFMSTLSLFSYGEQINSNRSWSAYSHYSQMVEDGIVPYERLGRTYRGIFILQYDHVDTPVIVIDPGRSSREFDIVDDFQRLRGSLGWHFTKDLFLGVSTSLDKVIGRPYEVDGDNTGIENKTFKDAETMLGDTTITAKWRFVGDKNTWNWTLVPYLTIPTGDEQSYNTDASISGGLQLAFTKYLDKRHKWRLHGNIGYGYFPGSVLDLGNDFKNIVDTKQRITGGIGLNWRFAKWGALYGEFMGLAGLPFDKDQNPVEGTFGARFHIGSRLMAFAGYGLEGITSARSHDNRFIAGLKLLLGKRKKQKVKRVIKKKKVIQKVDPVPSPAPVVFEKVEPVVTKEEILEKLSIARDVKFETNKAVIEEVSFSELDSAAETINQYSDQIANVEIQGHTDSRGSSAYNKSLSQRRADSVRAYLVEKGVPAEKLSSVGYGEEFPIDSNDTVQGRQRNRRVDFSVTDLVKGN